MSLWADVICDLHEDMDSFPSCWMVSEAGPASKTGIFAPNITFRSSFRQSTWYLHHFNYWSKEFHHPCWMRLVCLHIQPVPSPSHVKPMKNCKKMHLKFLLHASIPAAILRVPIQPRQLAPEQTMRVFLFYWNIDWKYCWPNLDIGDCNAKAFTPNFDPLCQQGQVVIEEVVKPNLKQNIINRHQIRWWWWWWWGVCHVFAYFIFSLF